MKDDYKKIKTLEAENEKLKAEPQEPPERGDMDGRD
jgi:hypothetical protein